MIISYIKDFLIKFILLILISSIIQSCSSIKTKTERSDINDIIYLPRQKEERAIAERGGGNFVKDLFGGGSNKTNSSLNQLSINPYLWKASLDILSSTMPLASVDSNSGIIISDWYNVKNKNNERVKISVLINSQELRADGVKVSIFRQVQKSSSWTNIAVNPEIIVKLERKIIKKASALANNN